MSRHRPGVVAAGSTAAAAAARQILVEGGNAFDAVVAGCFAACVAEPTMASLGGGGFLLARTAGGDETLYDFFAHTPVEQRRTAATRGELDFYPIECDFGDATQVFHIGTASVATPGVVKGLFEIRRELGTMPMARLVEPAVAAARGGLVVDELRAFTQDLLRPILTATAESTRVFVVDRAAEGDVWRNPELAEVLSALAEEGEDLFYRGELARTLAAACAAGGHLTMDDLRRYRVERRKPLEWRYRGHRLVSNPAPSTGGSLIAFALRLLEEHPPAGDGFASAAHLERLARVMALTNEARAEALRRPSPVTGHPLLHAPFLEPYRRALRRHLSVARGTTHLSVADGDGNLASLSVSNGEGSGVVLPGSGTMLNNMLGEEDLHPGGLGRWPENRRLASMMAPTLVERADGRWVALGSGGSNRLRTAILQVLVNLLDLGLPLAEAVRRPRIHHEGDRLDVEPGLPRGAVDALRPLAGECRLWARGNLYFGGVHAVELDSRLATAVGAGDPRRGGVVMSTEDR